jgi:5'-nucleotidase
VPTSAPTAAPSLPATTTTAAAAAPLETVAIVTTPTVAATNPPATASPATDASTTTVFTETTPVPRTINVLVTNDDGYDAPGIDAVVQYLRTVPAVNVIVVAPATNESDSGTKITPGGATTVTDVKTLSGYPAKAVTGSPADSVNWALNGGIPTKPDLVISGADAGQNLGSLIPTSGTIGAAATAARAGIPAIAISQGFATAPQTPYFAASVKVLGDYFTDSLDAYRNGDGVPLISINVPTCPANALFPTLEAPPAPADPSQHLGDPAKCDGPLPGDATSDVQAFDAGHAVISYLDPATLAGEPSPG